MPSKTDKSARCGAKASCCSRTVDRRDSVWRRNVSSRRTSCAPDRRSKRSANSRTHATIASVVVPTARQACRTSSRRCSKRCPNRRSKSLNSSRIAAMSGETASSAQFADGSGGQARTATRSGSTTSRLMKSRSSAATTRICEARATVAAGISRARESRNDANAECRRSSTELEGRMAMAMASAPTTAVSAAGSSCDTKPCKRWTSCSSILQSSVIKWFNVTCWPEAPRSMSAGEASA
mmetsp:Transcript_85714/g.247539  ORF Transcript_85714/g.247539 Transcript_85714/m.247539 type:complete len:238 (+) Transcript_85714:473-1186(+)